LMIPIDRWRGGRGGSPSGAYAFSRKYLGVSAVN